MAKIKTLELKIKSCSICKDILNPNPILKISPNAKILIAGQAPGKKVDESGVLFNDASGDRLRDWLGVTKEQFYDENNFEYSLWPFVIQDKQKVEINHHQRYVQTLGEKHF